MKEFSSDGIASQFVPRISTIVLLAVFVGGLFFVDLSSLIPEDKDGEQQPSTAFSLLTGGEKITEENPGTSPTNSPSETTTSTPPETTTSPTNEKQDDKNEGGTADNSHDNTGAVKEPPPNQHGNPAPQNNNTAPQNNNYRPPAYRPPLPRYTPPAPSPSSTTTPAPDSNPSEQQGGNNSSQGGNGGVMKPRGAPSPSLTPETVE